MNLYLDTFDLTDMAALGAELREHAEGRAGLGEAAQRVVELLDGVIRMPGVDGLGTQEPGLALARLYVTRRFRNLDAQQAGFARRMAGMDLDGDTSCLTLIGSQGRRAEWCDPRRSQGHVAIPLVSPESVARLPMISALFEQLGVDVMALLRHQLLRDSRARRLGLDVFHIEKAEGSPWVPAQDFVRAEGVASCVAIGAVLPDGEVLTLLLFSRTTVAKEVAARMKPVSLSLELALLPYLGLERQIADEATIYALQRLVRVKDAIVDDRVAQLKEAKEQAEAQTRLREELLRNVRHEIRTPMNGVLGMLEMLKLSTGMRFEDRRLCEIAYGSAHGLMHILENLIDYSDLITKRRQRRDEPVDIGSLLQGLIDGLRVQGSAIEWELKTGSGCSVPVVTDRLAVHGLMRQLMENALKFTNAGRVTVRADLVEGSGELYLEVSDTGVGMSAERQAELFEPFRQGDGTTTRRVGGTGLGLAIAREFLKQLGGRMEVESELGQGSRFRVWAPVGEVGS